MNVKALRAVAEGLRALHREAKDLALLDLCDGERIEAERALQRKAHLFVDDMREALNVEPSEQYRANLQAALVATAGVNVGHRRPSSRSSRRYLRRPS